jgi:hypothetical protein
MVGCVLLPGALQVATFHDENVRIEQLLDLRSAARRERRMEGLNDRQRAISQSAVFANLRVGCAHALGFVRFVVGVL